MTLRTQPRRRWSCGLILIFCLLPTLAGAQPELAFKFRLGSLLQQESAGSEAGERDRAELFSDLYGGALLPFSRHWRGYVRGQGFISTGEIFLSEEETPQRTEGFLALREAWVEYRGLNSYPGDVLRLGRQRLRAYDGLWWDEDIESLQWIVERTTLRGRLALAAPLATARSDSAEIPIGQRQRRYLAGDLAWSYRRGHAIGIRGTLAADHGELRRSMDPNENRTRQRRQAWLGVYLDSQYHDYRADHQLAYWAELVGLIGEQKRLLNPGGSAPLRRTREDLLGSSADLGLRWHPLQGPLRLGFGYAVGSGGRDDGDVSRQFEQTGLHSNRSRFTGTRTILYRFNEALQPDLENLSIASTFVALQLPRIDASLLAHQLWRRTAETRIVTRGLDTAPGNAGNEIGRGYDLILSWYFDELTTQPLFFEDTAANLRLRLSRFEPGQAYTGTGATTLNRGTVEATVYF